MKEGVRYREEVEEEREEERGGGKKVYKGKMWGVEQPGPFEGGPDFQTNAKQGGNVTEANHPRTANEKCLELVSVDFI